MSSKRSRGDAAGIATIRDVARLAGVSIATVSRTLHSPALVREETREQVLRIVAESGYAPNLLARSLRRHEAGAILVMVRDITNPFYPEIFLGVEGAARALGFNVLIGNTGDDPARERDYLQLVHTRRADGMIVVTGKLPESWPDPSRRPIAAVIACEPIAGVELPIVQIDNEAAAADMVRHLIALGHRRIAHITGPLDQIIAQQRLAGWRRALRDAGLSADEALVARGDFRLPSGVAAAKTLLAGRRHPTAIFASNDESAIGAIQAIHEAGLSVPADISVAGFDDILFAAAAFPPLTTIRQPRRQLGEQAMTLLHGLLAGRPDKPHAKPARIVLPTELVRRQSTAPVS
jgi:LacI family repressor for deo operon, udp, cdd, tsx, nupC, and nupG